MVAGPSVEAPYLPLTRARLERREVEFVRRAGLILRVYRNERTAEAPLSLPLPPRWDLLIGSHAWDRLFRQRRDECLGCGIPPGILIAGSEHLRVAPATQTTYFRLLGSASGSEIVVLGTD